MAQNKKLKFNNYRITIILVLIIKTLDACDLREREYMKKR